jgi:hypothetical protein
MPGSGSGTADSILKLAQPIIMGRCLLPGMDWVRISKKDGHIVAIGEGQPVVR